MINILDYGYKLEFSDRLRDSENHVVGVIFLDKELKTYRSLYTSQYKEPTNYMQNNIEKSMKRQIEKLTKKGYKEQLWALQKN